jgi:hypothetical protein
MAGHSGFARSLFSGADPLFHLEQWVRGSKAERKNKDKRRSLDLAQEDVLFSFKKRWAS